VESEKTYFSIEFYRDLLKKHAIFDMPKLLDICAIYGSSQEETVQKLLENVFEADPRFEEEFVEMSNSLITINKKALTLATKI